jgi:hypothetical protein
MKRLIYQYYYHEADRLQDALDVQYKYWEYSEKSIKKYAEEIGAEYKFLNKGHQHCAFYGIFIPFLEGWANDYDQICFIDSDMLATRKTYNVFDSFRPNGLNGWVMPTLGVVNKYWNHGSNIRYLNQFGGHINTGTVLFHKGMFAPFTRFIEKHMEDIYNKSVDNEPFIGALGKFDQALINCYVCRASNLGPLDVKYNYHLNKKKVSDRWDATLIHYHRDKKKLMQEDFNDDRILK